MNKIINKFFDEASSLFFIGVLLVSSLALNAQDSEAEVEEKFERNFRVSREMRDEILVYDPIWTKFCAKF